MNNFKVVNFNLNFLGIKDIFKLIYKNKSPLRIFHNNFIKNVELKGKVIDLGSGTHNSYLDFIKKKNISTIYFADNKDINKPNFVKLDLEKNLEINDNEYDTVILFNVLEHISEYKNLLKEIFRILKKGGKLEIFVPFMHMYHEDPKDVMRPTHEYLSTLLTQVGFKNEVFLIGAGPFSVISEILLKYVKFKFLKILLLIFFLIIDKIVKRFSKDYYKFYNGTHCSSVKE
jgi:SAM-dependent methyltransferase